MVRRSLKKTSSVICKKKTAMYRSLDYMGLKPNMKISDIKVDKIFIGSCTNGRIDPVINISDCAVAQILQISARLVRISSDW